MRVEKFPDWHEDWKKAYHQLPEDTLKRGEEILSNLINELPKDDWEIIKKISRHKDSYHYFGVGINDSIRYKQEPEDKAEKYSQAIKYWHEE